MPLQPQVKIAHIFTSAIFVKKYVLVRKKYVLVLSEVINFFKFHAGVIL